MENYRPIISIIIPLYNSENYITDCLNSIFDSNIDEQKYEIVIVNDGSTDRSKDIAKELIANKNNCRIISQENQGLSGARNTGIKACYGEFFWCVDADDMVNPHEVMKIFTLLTEQYPLDILAVLEQKVTQQMVPIKLNCYHETVDYESVITGRQAMLQGYNPSSACALIVRKQLITDNNIYFTPRIAHQDVEWTYRLFPYAKKVFFSHLIPYYYIMRPDSISRSVKPEKKLKYILDDIVIIESFHKLASQYASNDYELAQTIERRALNTHFGLVLSVYKSKKMLKDLGIMDDIMKSLREHSLFPLKADFLSWKKNYYKHIINYYLI